MSARNPIGREAYTVVMALLAAMAIGSVLILVVGQSPARVYGHLLARSWGDAYGIGQVLFKATPLVFTGLAVALAFRAGLFNIGAEGQMLVGSFATALLAASLPAATPALLALPLAIGAGMVAGGCLGAIPGVLRARFGAHEVINTIMLNFIAAAVVLWLGNEWFFVSETTHTAPVVAGAQLPRLGLGASAGNVSIVLAALAALAVWVLLFRTRIGFAWRAVGLSPRAAEAGAIPVGRVYVWSMAVAGALAGMVGSSYVLGYKHYFEEGMGRGAGFMGIAVALLGRSHPVGVVLAALFFGTLSQGGLAVSELVPKEIVEVLEGVIILTVAAAAATVPRWWQREARP